MVVFRWTTGSWTVRRSAAVDAALHVQRAVTDPGSDPTQDQTRPRIRTEPGSDQIQDQHQSPHLKCLLV